MQRFTWTDYPLDNRRFNDGARRLELHSEDRAHSQRLPGGPGKTDGEFESLNEAAVSNGVVRGQGGRRQERLKSPKGLTVSLGFSGGVVRTSIPTPPMILILDQYRPNYIQLLVCKL